MADQLFHVSSVQPRCRITVMGVGGAGCNAIARLAASWQDGPAVVAVNTDTQALATCPMSRVLQIGSQTTKGLGAGGDVSVGRLAAEESQAALQEALSACDLLFLVAGLGGGTGTGALPVIAQTAHKMGILTLCFAAMPFAFEGDRRRRQAEEGLRILQQVCDAVVCMPNDRLLELADPSTELEAAFRKSDEMLGSGIHGLWKLLAQSGVINLDFADLRQLAERSGGSCAFGYAEATGPSRAARVLQDLANSPMLEKGRLLAEASAILVNVTAGPDVTLADVQGIMGQINALARPGVHSFFGAIIDSSFRDRLALTVLAAENWLESRRDARANVRAAPAEAAVEVGVGAAAEEAPKRRDIRGEQITLNFEPIDKGRFRGVEPTFFAGEDLDIPTFIRRGIRLSFED